MENVFVLFIDSRLIGVYTTHRKAVQAMIEETFPCGYSMSDYSFEFGVEFYTFTKPGEEQIYELQEVTPDERA